MTARRLVVVGAGLAGARAAEAARLDGWTGEILVFGDEPLAPYERPPLSKGILRGEEAPDSSRVHPDGFYRDHDIELVTDGVHGLDAGGRKVELASGGLVGFDVAVLATGAEPRRLSVPGAQLEGVHHLRTVDDAVRLREAVLGASRVAVVGAGWIGSEVAASVRQMGVPVVLVDPLDVPLARVLGHELGAVVADLHAEHGVELRLGCGVDAVLGSDHVEGVRLGDGRTEAADVVVAGIGVTPRTDAVTGLHVEDGILVDEHLETSVPGIYAAGDVARARNPRYGRHLRVEHWANAKHQGAVAGANAAGQRARYDRLPYFFSDMYDLGLEYVGHAGPDHELVVRGDPAARELVALWHRGGVVDAAMHVNVWGALEDLQRLVGHGRPIEPARLADPAVPLDQLPG